MADLGSTYRNVVQKLLSSFVGDTTATNIVNNPGQQPTQPPSEGILGKLYESLGYSNPTQDTANPVTDTGQPAYATYATTVQSDDKKPQGTPDAEKTNDKEREEEESAPKKRTAGNKVGQTLVDWGGLAGIAPGPAGVMLGTGLQTAGNILDYNDRRDSFSDNNRQDWDYYAGTDASNTANNGDFVSDPWSMSMPSGGDISNLSDEAREYWQENTGKILGDTLMNMMLPGSANVAKPVSHMTEDVFLNTLEEAMKQGAKTGDDMALGITDATAKEAAKAKSKAAEEAAKQAEKSKSEAAEQLKEQQMRAKILGEEVPKAAEQSVEETAQKASKEAAEQTVKESDRLAAEQENRLRGSVDMWKNPDTRSLYKDVVEEYISSLPNYAQNELRSKMPYSTTPGKLYGAKAADELIPRQKELADSANINAMGQIASRFGALAEPLANTMGGSRSIQPNDEQELLDSSDNPEGGFTDRDGTDSGSKKGGGKGSSTDNELPDEIFGMSRDDWNNLSQGDQFRAAMQDQAMRDYYGGLSDTFGDLVGDSGYENWRYNDFDDYHDNYNLVRDLLGFNEEYGSSIAIPGWLELYQNIAEYNGDNQEDFINKVMDYMWNSDATTDMYQYLNNVNNGEYRTLHNLGDVDTTGRIIDYMVDNGYFPGDAGNFFNSLDYKDPIQNLDNDDLGLLVMYENLKNINLSGWDEDDLDQVAAMLRRAGDKNLQVDFSDDENAKGKWNRSENFGLDPILNAISEKRSPGLVYGLENDQQQYVDSPIWNSIVDEMMGLIEDKTGKAVTRK